MAKNRLTDALKTALMGTAAAAGTLGGGAAAMAAAGFVDAAGQLISWYASDVTPEYEPFGTYLFCQQTGFRQCPTALLFSTWPWQDTLLVLVRSLV